MAHTCYAPMNTARTSLVWFGSPPLQSGGGGGFIFHLRLRVMLLVVALVAEGKALHIVPVTSTVETRFRELPLPVRESLGGGVLVQDGVHTKPAQHCFLIFYDAWSSNCPDTSVQLGAHI